MTNNLSQPWNEFRSRVRDSFRQRSNALEQCFDQSLTALQGIDRKSNSSVQCIALNIITVAVADQDNSDSLSTLITTVSQRKNILLMETHVVTDEFESALR
jgi:hypothetical protein